MIAYTKGEIQDMTNRFLTASEACNLYTQKFLNYTGTVADGNQKYSEVIAECILDRVDILEQCDWVVTRERSYNAGHKPKKFIQIAKNRREEEHRARAMMGKTYAVIGEIIDYQTPLKNVRNTGDGRSIGKIDLLSYNKAENRAYILEYKKPRSPETLLRCVLEAYTYWRTANHDGLRKSFAQMNDQTEIRKAALVYRGSVAADEFVSVGRVRDLMNKLRVELFILDEQVVESHTFDNE